MVLVLGPTLISDFWWCVDSTVFAKSLNSSHPFTEKFRHVTNDDSGGFELRYNYAIQGLLIFSHFFFTWGAWDLDWRWWPGCGHWVPFECFGFEATPQFDASLQKTLNFLRLVTKFFLFFSCHCTLSDFFSPEGSVQLPVVLISGSMRTIDDCAGSLGAISGTVFWFDFYLRWMTKPFN